MQYSDFQNQVASEKITLAHVFASKRLMGWSLLSGSVYSLPNVSALITAIEDSGVAYTEVDSLNGVIAGSYYLDRDTSTLFIHTSTGAHPNGRFISMVQKLCFANVPITLPHDLASGEEVYWLPLIASTSAFGVEIDTVNQTSEAIEGSGTLTFHNDQEFWIKNYDKLVFENQECHIYSYNRDLPATQAKLLFRGKIDRRRYNSITVSLSLKDTLGELRAPVALNRVVDLSERTSETEAQTFQRMILGKVKGHLPINLDQELNGYPMSGAVSITVASLVLTGVGTSFLKLSPDDTLVVGEHSFTIASVESDTSLTVTEPHPGPSGISGASYLIKSSLPKRYMNREWLVAGHAVKQPTQYTRVGTTITKLVVNRNDNFEAGDLIYIGDDGAGTRAIVSEVTGSSTIKLATSLESVPPIGTRVIRPSVQNVMLEDLPLMYERDYTFNAATARLSLRLNAEANADPVRQMSTSLTFNAGNRTVTGAGLDAIFKPGYMAGRVGDTEMFEVMAVAETTLLLRTPSTITGSGTPGLYRPFTFNPREHKLTCDVLGRTEDGTPTGTLLKTAPQIVKALLIDMGLSDRINHSSFAEAIAHAPETIGMVVPNKISAKQSPTYRDTINNINKSVFGSLIQTNAFNLNYFVLQPNKSGSTVRLSHNDILDFSVESTAEKINSTVVIEFLKREYSPIEKSEVTSATSVTSSDAVYLLKTNRERTFDTVLVNRDEAQRYGRRWALLLDSSTCSIKIITKLQTASLSVGDLIDFDHPKLFERIGSSVRRRILLVEGIKKTGGAVEINTVDLSGTMVRVACLSDSTNTWADSDDEERTYFGFITDEYGLIDNDPETHGLNIIW